MTLSHLDADGHARMVDVSDKAETHREATARGRIVMKASTLALGSTIIVGWNASGRKP